MHKEHGVVQISTHMCTRLNKALLGCTMLLRLQKITWVCTMFYEVAKNVAQGSTGSHKGCTTDIEVAQGARGYTKVAQQTERLHKEHGVTQGCLVYRR